MKRILVEGFDRDAVVLARTLAREGHRVTLAGHGDASQQALELRASRVIVRARASLDTEPGHHDEAFLDVWTPEVAPRVALLRESGCVVRCLGDLVLEGLQPRPRGETAIEVTFQIDHDGILRVRARDANTGQEQRASIDVVGAQTSAEVDAALLSWVRTAYDAAG